MYLTRAELHELTGRARALQQLTWLRRWRWRFAIAADGSPRVARAYWSKRMVDETLTMEDSPGPNFEALKDTA